MHDEHLAELHHPALWDTAIWANRSQLSVARTLPVPFAAAIAAAVSLTRPPLPIERRWDRDEIGPLQRSDLAPARAHGHLLVGRRTVPVEIELAPWADGSSELVLRPDVRAPHRWSGRRRRSWYASAHPAADALRQQLIDSQPRVRRAPSLHPGRESEEIVRRLAG